MYLLEKNVFLFQNTKFEAVVKSEASHDPRGTATGKEVIIKVTNTHTKKVDLFPFFTVVDKNPYKTEKSQICIQNYPYILDTASHKLLKIEHFYTLIICKDFVGLWSLPFHR